MPGGTTCGRRPGRDRWTITRVRDNRPGGHGSDVTVTPEASVAIANRPRASPVIVAEPSGPWSASGRSNLPHHTSCFSTGFESI